MKRNLLIAAIALLAVAFVSCQKDGVYKPKKRISKVYNEWKTTRVVATANDTTTSADSVAPYICQEWTWGKKTLTSIIYKEYDGDGSWSINYSYDDKNRISVCSSGDEKAEYTYGDDNMLQSIKFTDDSDDVTVLKIAYDGKVPASITTEYTFTNDKKLSNFAKSVIPSYICAAIEADKLHLKSTTVTRSMTSVFEWDGENISRVVTTDVDNDKSTTTYEYDDKLNPFRGMYANLYDEEPSYDIIYSKNNVTKITDSYVWDNTTYTDEAEFSYEYDGKLPIKLIRTFESEYEYSGKTTTITSVYTTTYEYTK